MSWKEDLYDLDTDQAVDLDDLTEASTEAKNGDIGFVNPTSGAGLLARDNGTLEAFADYGLGFRFSRDSQSLSVFAPSVHIFTQDIQKYDKVVKNTYLRDEYGDIESILSEVELTDEERKRLNEEL